MDEHGVSRRNPVLPGHLVGLLKQRRGQHPTFAPIGCEVIDGDWSRPDRKMLLGWD
jgi:hypothetical protein